MANFDRKVYCIPRHYYKLIKHVSLWETGTHDTAKFILTWILSTILKMKEMMMILVNGLKHVKHWNPRFNKLYVVAIAAAMLNKKITDMVKSAGKTHYKQTYCLLISIYIVIKSPFITNLFQHPCWQPYYICIGPNQQRNKRFVLAGDIINFEVQWNYNCHSLRL